jgi:hypothetical protein
MADRWSLSAIKHHREQADNLQAEIDHLTDPEYVAAKVRLLAKRRDQWNRLADELATYGERGFWDDEEETPVSILTTLLATVVVAAVIGAALWREGVRLERVANQVEPLVWEGDGA